MLKENQVIRLPQSGTAKVLFVNESRARVKLLSERNVQIETADGRNVNFTSGGREIDISPNSEIDILKH